MFHELDPGACAPDAKFSPRAQAAIYFVAIVLCTAFWTVGIGLLTKTLAAHRAKPSPSAAAQAGCASCPPARIDPAAIDRLQTPIRKETPINPPSIR